MQIYCNNRKFLHKKRVQLQQDWFGTPTWLPFHCSETPTAVTYSAFLSNGEKMLVFAIINQKQFTNITCFTQKSLGSTPVKRRGKWCHDHQKQKLEYHVYVREDVCNVPYGN